MRKLLLAVLGTSLVADAQTRVISTDMPCASPVHRVTSVGVAATNTPSAQLANRRYIQLCVSVENTGTPKVKCRVDGTAPVMGTTNVGDVLNVGDCIRYWIVNTVTPRCISDTAATAVHSIECL